MKRSLKKIVMLCGVTLMLLIVVSCESASIKHQTEVRYLEQGQKAPWEGYLISKRAMIILYEDAKEQTTEETADRLNKRFGE